MKDFLLFSILLTTFGYCRGSLISLTATPLIQSFTSHTGYNGITEYPVNYTQDWYITTNWINHTIKISFKTCHIESPKGFCTFDYLHVYDGLNSNSTRMLQTCCAPAPGPLVSSAGEIYLLFQTDPSIGDTGFEIEYWSNGITTTTTTTTVATTTTTSSTTTSSTPTATTDDTRTTTSSYISSTGTSYAFSSTNNIPASSSGAKTATSIIAMTSSGAYTSTSTTATNSNIASEIRNSSSAGANTGTTIYAHLQSTDPSTYSNTNTSTHSIGVADKREEIRNSSSAGANTGTTIYAHLQSTDPSTYSNTNTSTHSIGVADKREDNTLYIIIACVVTLVLVVIVVILIVVVCLKKNNRANPMPKSFLVEEEPKKTNLAKTKLSLPIPTTPPLTTVLPQTNLFDLELPNIEKGRGHQLPPIFTTTAIHTLNPN